MKELNKLESERFPKLIDAAKLDATLSILIMDRLGKNLDELFKMHGSQFSYKTINQLGIQLVNIFQQFHKTGWVYNDLKPDNICVG